MKRDKTIEEKKDEAMVKFLKEFAPTSQVNSELEDRIFKAIESEGTSKLNRFEPRDIKTLPKHRYFVFISAGMVLAAGLAAIISYSVIKNRENHQVANQQLEEFLEVAWNETFEVKDVDLASGIDDYLEY